MKELILLNPMKRKKTRKTGRRRVRRTTAARKRSTRRTRRTKSRAVRRNPYAMAKPRRRRRTRAVARRGGYRRRSVRRNPARRGGIVADLFNQQNVMTAGGAVIASSLTSWAMNSAWAANLPGKTNQFGNIAYRLGIPLAGGLITRQFAPRRFRPFANGMIIGGLILAIDEGIRIANEQFGLGVPTGVPSGTQGTSEYFRPLSTRRRLNGVSGVGQRRTPGYSGHNVFGTGGIYEGESAFMNDAWG